MLNTIFEKMNNQILSLSRNRPCDSTRLERWRWSESRPGLTNVKLKLKVHKHKTAWDPYVVHKHKTAWDMSSRPQAQDCLGYVGINLLLERAGTWTKFR